MNERQRNAFLWTWTRQRRHGRLRIALLGAAIGAIGGALFAALILYAMTMDGGDFSVDEGALPPFLLALSRALGPTGFLFALSLPAFAFLGLVMADRVWSMQEGLYHQLLDQGARIPEKRVSLKLADRAPHLAVIAVFTLVLCGLLFGLWWELNRGSL